MPRVNARLLVACWRYPEEEHWTCLKELDIPNEQIVV